MIFCGIAVFAAIGALSHEHGRAFSASIIYLGLGAGAAVVIQLAGIDWVDPLSDESLIERLTELAVIIALFGAGLKLDRPLDRESWAGVTRLLVVAMPLTIAAVALFGTQVMGLSLAAAIVLGAMLAPTDPVLAGDIGVGPPGDEDEHDPNFSITGEAGLNDGLALPFLFLGLFIADEGGSGWLGEWLLADVVYAIGIAVAIGAVVGYGVGALAVNLRDRRLLATAFDAWLAIPTVLLLYGLTEVAGAYGFVAAFVGGVALRRYEHGHEYNRGIHDGAESVEKFGELAVVLLLGSMFTLDGLGAPGIAGWLLVPVLLLAIRPSAVAIAMLRSPAPDGERAFVAWFGVRGIGSLYYAAIAVGAGAIAADEIETIVWTVIACVAVSIVVHGATAAPLARRWLPPEALDPGISSRR
ncbi:MAG: cation:proton antiporter [Actinomycetota bacterium]|nr:cation:proton antiporter [Actinomycetota bacterium]